MAFAGGATSRGEAQATQLALGERHNQAATVWEWKQNPYCWWWTFKSALHLNIHDVARPRAAVKNASSDLSGNGAEDGVQQSDLREVPLQRLAGLQHQ